MICETCGVQYSANVSLKLCPICDDERQYLPEGGQRWTDLPTISKGRKIVVQERETGLFEFRVEPEFGIGQRMFFVTSPAGNFTWDFVPFVDESILDFINGHGGVTAMAVSHPHFYSTMRNWSDALETPVYIHEQDKQWAGEHFPQQQFWDGDRLILGEGAQLIHCGGHFEGSSVLHIDLPDKKLLLVGDTISPGSDRKSISVMRSYPNRIPVDPQRLGKISWALKDIQFDRIYAGFPEGEILKNGREIFDVSIARYLKAISF